MAKPQTDPVLELLYSDELESTRADALRAGLSDEAKHELDDFQLIQHAFNTLAEADEPSATTTQNILRQARLAAAERTVKPKAGFFATLFTPAVGLAALLIAVSIPTLYFLNQSDPIDRASEDSEIVAVGAVDSPPAQRVAATDSKHADPAQPSTASERPKIAKGAGEAARPAGVVDPNEEPETPLIAKVDPLKAEPKKGLKTPKSSKSSSSRKTKGKPRPPQTPKNPDSIMEQLAGAEPSLNTDSFKNSGSGSSGSTYSYDPYPSQQPTNSSLNIGSGSGSSGMAADNNYAANGDLGNMNRLDVLSPNDVEQRAEASPIQIAIAIYEQGDHQGAVNHINTFIDSASGADRVMARFYRGMARYQLKQYLEASEDLHEIVVSHKDFARYDEARYTYAQTLAALNQAEGAREHFQGLAESNSPYAEPAQNNLDALGGAKKGGAGVNQQSSSTAKGKKKKKGRKKAKKQESKSSAPVKRSSSDYEPKKKSGSMSID